MTSPASSDEPAILVTVVVPGVNTVDDMVRTLTALQGQSGVSLEVLLLDRTGEETRTAVRARFPWVHVIAVPPSTTIPAMRAQAFHVARGQYVAVIEDHVIVPPGWARDMVAAVERAKAESPGGAVVGGSVTNLATGRVVDWAAFLCEYSHCIAPMRGGTVAWLPGNNVVYPRQLLRAYLDRLSPDRWENHLHDLMKADGVRLVLHPEIVVGHEKYYTIGEYVSQRYLYARSFAGARVQGSPRRRRVAFALASLALPPLLFARTVLRIFRKRRHRIELGRSLPLIALFVVAWAAGELVGYGLGAGDSLEGVR